MHIAQQVAKQVVAASQPSTRKLLVDIAVKRAQQSPEIGELFADLKIHQMDVRKFLDEIVQKMPIVGIPIEGISKDLEDWAKTLNIKVRL